MSSSRSERIRQRILSEWRGVDEPMDLERGVHRPAAFVERVLRKLGLGDGLQEQEVLDAWKEVAGDFLAAHSHPQSVKGGHLVLRVTQPSMRFHLEQMKPVLLKRLQERFGEERIRSIRFGLG
jgi:predicted nucleic acid-binding Zn ribbon protein